jgi:hypothetical protein
LDSKVKRDFKSYIWICQDPFFLLCGGLEEDQDKKDED